MAGIKTPELDARILLNEAMKQESAFVYSHPDFLITNAQYSKFRRFVRRRKRGEPIAYIVGHKEFYGRDFIVNKNVLIPRPESEWLVEKGLAFLKKNRSCPDDRQTRIINHGGRRGPLSFPDRINKMNILDMGTGSGCLIISLVNELNKQFNDSKINRFSFYGTEINKRAIEVAKNNSKAHKINHLIRFYRSNLFSNPRIPRQYYLIMANLPYVPYQSKIRNQKSEIRIKESIFFEPQEAIFAADKGMVIIKTFLNQARTRLLPTGTMFLELDPRNANDLLIYAKNTFPKAKINLEKDLAGLNRYLVIAS